MSEFINDPCGRFVVGRTWLQFATKGFAGALLRGTLTGACMHELLPLALVTHGPAMRPHAGFVDGSQVQGIEPVVVSLVGVHVETHHQLLRDKILRLAGVRGPGLPGAVTEGFFRLVSSPYPVEVFADRHEALAWLGVSHLASMVTDLEHAHSGEGPGTVVELLDLLQHHLRDWALPDAAKALGVGVRTLQRRLRDENTTFQEQLDVARVRAAQRLMLESSLTLAQIAFEVGCASASSFNVVFRRVVGQAPGAWLEQSQVTHRESADRDK